MATEETKVSGYNKGIGQETAVKLIETGAIILALSFATTTTVTQWIEFSELIQCEMWDDWLWRIQFSNQFGLATLVAMSTLIFVFGMVSEDAWWSFHWVFVTEIIIALPFYMAVHLMLMQFLTKHSECQQDNYVNELKGEGLTPKQLLDDAEDAETSTYGDVVGPIAWYLFCLPLVLGQFVGAVYVNYRAKNLKAAEPQPSGLDDAVSGTKLVNPNQVKAEEAGEKGRNEEEKETLKAPPEPEQD